MNKVTGISRVGFFASRGVGFLWKLGFASLFIVFLFVQASALAYQQQDINVFFKEIGDQFLDPFKSLEESSTEVLSSESLGFSDSFLYWKLYFSIYKIFLGVWALYRILYWLLGNTNPPIIIWGFAIGIFSIIMVSYYGFIQNYSAMYPIKTSIDGIKAVIHIIL